MALDKLVDSSQLDTDLTSVANAIRTKGGTSSQLAFPEGFVSAVQAIPTGTTPTGTKQISISSNGTTTEDVASYANAEITVNVPVGSGYSLKKSGTVTTTTDASSTLYISVSGYSGTPKALLVYADAPLDSVAQAIAAVTYETPLPTAVQTGFNHRISYHKYRKADNSYVYGCAANGAANVTWDATNSRITCVRVASGYLWKANTYHWFIYE